MAETKEANRPEFTEIKDWIQEHLGKPNDLILGNDTKNRTVIVNSTKGPVPYYIPKKTTETIQEFKNAWVDVYLGCLEFLDRRVSELFFKERLILEDENTVIVGDQKFVFSNDMDSVAYINTLERITEAYDESLKKEEKNPINFTTCQVEITTPSKEQIKTIKEPLPKQTIQNKDIEAHIAQNLNRAPKRRNFDNYFVGQKLNDNDTLSPAECSKLRDEKLVFVTCTSLSKGENTFRDNIDMFIETINSVPRAAFITGRAIKQDQVAKEVSKIMRLCGSAINTGIIMYEINNEAIQSMVLEKQTIIDAVTAIEQLLDILGNEQYKPLVCLDSETNKVIKQTMGSTYAFKYPTFLRILPRQLDEVKETDNLIVMDPQYDNDQVVIKNQNVVNYLELNKQTENSYAQIASTTEEHFAKAA